MAHYSINAETGERTLVPNTMPAEQYRPMVIENIRTLCTQAIVETAGIDEKTQLNAIAGIYSPERCEAIKNYIAACRNEYLRCKALILAATTNDEADAIQFNAPPTPEGL